MHLEITPFEHPIACSSALVLIPFSLIRIAILSEGQYFGHLYCHSNQLGEAALKTLFVSLGQVPKPTPEYPRPPQCRISYSDNPGNKESLKEILKEKNWIVDEE
jgi:hypothetical protein